MLTGDLSNNPQKGGVNEVPPSSQAPSFLIDFHFQNCEAARFLWKQDQPKGTATPDHDPQVMPEITSNKALGR